MEIGLGTKKVCYTIMPYGGNDEVLRRHFDTVFQLFMFIPAMKGGFEVKREDYNPQAGTITRNIIVNLAQADLVIADLSQNNWNVAYELGVRHVLVKSKTILLCDDKTELKFDIRGFNVITYDGSNPSNNMHDVQRKIEEAIAERMTTKNADNIVHETLGLPYEKLVSYVTDEGSDMEKALRDTRAELETTKKMYAQLGEKLKKYESEEEQKANNQRSAERESISRKISEAFQLMEYSGDKIIIKLRQLTSADEPDTSEIQSVLEKALGEGYLTESNFRDMYRIFKGLGIPQLTNLILEVASERYPQSLDFKSYLADAYSDNYATFDKAIQLADEVLQVKTINGKPSSSCKRIDADQLGACLNAYIGVDRFDILSEIIPALLDQVPQHRQLLLRNLSVCYRELGNYEEQERVLKQIITEFPMNDINHFQVFAFFHMRNEYLQAYYHLLIASALDSDVIDYYINFAGFIFDNHYYVDNHGEIVELKGRDEYARVAVPFLMKAIKAQPSQNTVNRCINFMLKNGISRYVDVISDWIRSEMEPKGIPEVNYSGIDYLEKVADNLNEDICNKMVFDTGLGSFD